MQLADLHGTGMAGLLWTRAADASAGSALRFLDLTGGVQAVPARHGMDNHLGARTTVTYAPSTADYLRDQARSGDPVADHAAVPGARGRPGSRCSDAHLRRPADHRVPLPPRLLGRRRAGVPRLRAGRAARHRNLRRRTAADPGDGPPEHHSPPTLTKTWFHPGPVAAAEAGDWTELDLSARVLARRPADAGPARHR